MIEISKATNTKDRLRLYLEYHKNTVVDVNKLAVIAKTREWARQLRYLRAENHMDIEYIPKNGSKHILIEGYIFHDPARNME